MKREAVYTHYFKEAVIRDGVPYQHVVGLNELWDWQLILDLSEDPSWQLVTTRRLPVCRFPGERRPLFARRARYRCPSCSARLRDCEDRYPDGRMQVFALSPRPSSFERWHDDACRCPACGARVGLVRRTLDCRTPALPRPGIAAAGRTGRAGTPEAAGRS